MLATSVLEAGTVTDLPSFTMLELLIRGLWEKASSSPILKDIMFILTVKYTYMTDVLTRIWFCILLRQV